jgi:uncharacterized protein
LSGGERDLGRLLADLNPMLASERYAFEATESPEWDDELFALVREDEGITAIRVSPAGEWARISLGVHSSLDAVGLTAAFSRALTNAGISSNVVAALFHDHIFVHWEQREEALQVLTALRG